MGSGRSSCLPSPSFARLCGYRFFLPMLTNRPFRENTVAKKRVKATSDA